MRFIDCIVDLKESFMAWLKWALAEDKPCYRGATCLRKRGKDNDCKCSLSLTIFKGSE